MVPTELLPESHATLVTMGWGEARWSRSHTEAETKGAIGTIDDSLQCVIGGARALRPRKMVERCPNVTSDPNSSRRGTTDAVRIYVSRGRLDYLWNVGGPMTIYCIRWRATQNRPVAKS
jgi:hypothetical protein